MSGNILTPVALWDGFSPEKSPEFGIIDERTNKDLIVTRVFVEGKRVGEGRVRIFVTVTRTKQMGLSPAIMLLGDVTRAGNGKIAEDLASKGYTVMEVDLGGKSAGKEYFTVYPEEISYAVYENSKDRLFGFDGSANASCWYEWACAARYALAYLKNQPFVTAVGGLGIGYSATVLWQVAAMDKLDCAAFALNAGWLGYRGIHKFSGQVEPQFSDDLYKFIAGVDAQSYAVHVKCPVLVLSACGSENFDNDRAFDTVSRIGKGVYTAVHYSVGYRNTVGKAGYNDAAAFFAEFLMRAGQPHELPAPPEIRCAINEKKMTIEAEADGKGLKGVSIYAAEETADPAKRCWVKLPVSRKENIFSSEYSPVSEAGAAFFFAQAEYADGFQTGSPVVAKKFAPEEVETAYKQNVVYSSREEGAESVFSPAREDGDGTGGIDVSDEEGVYISRGPMGIEGVSCKYGLLSFDVNASRFKPAPDAILLVDAYCKDDAEFTVKLISDYFGEKTEYAYRVKLKGGDVWHNVQIDRPKFKTEGGMGIRSYDGVEAVEFICDCGEWLINNVLFV